MIQLPDIRQADDHSCGRVAIRVLLRHLRMRPRNAPPLPSEIDGLDPRAIETYLRGLGLRVLSGSMTWEDLRHLTASGRPVICLITPQHGVGHYVIVSAIELQLIRYQCPTDGPSYCGQNAWHAGWTEVDRLGARYHQWGISAWRV